ncbi:unnamed protein product [Lupinus luteus]|uniref:Signal peptidase complex catalytic subunit SEC11 n=1 Tax=Lupinus luteus TaxID=3873 RepID=A0AAV1W6G6_LUPLU
MGWSTDIVDSVKSFQFRQTFSQLITLGLMISSALMLWRGLMYITGTESPIIVVISGSMEPGFKRGDILFLHMSKDPVRTGDIVVFRIDVHEPYNVQETYMLTKGDNNPMDDRVLYNDGQYWLQRHHLMGKAVGILPYGGWMTIIMSEKPFVKYIVLGALALLSLTTKD